MKEPKGKTYTVEEADRLFNGGQEETEAIIVRMKKSRNGTISCRVMQEGKEGVINSWAVAAATYLLIECCISNAPEMGKVLSAYMDKPYMERRFILKSVLETMENKEKEIKEKANAN